VADFAVQAIILRSLHEAFPEDPICAEEAASALRTDRPLLDRVVAAVQSVIPTATPEDVCQWIDYGTYRGNGSRYWTLDPVDGTKGFLRGEQYAVCLALLVDGAPVLGVQGCPNLPAQPGSYTDALHDGTPGALFYAVRGHGAYAEPMPAPATAAYEADKRPPIHLQLPPTFSMAAEEVRFCESVEAGHSSHDDAARVAMELGIVRPSLRMDSQAKYCAMARGDAQILLRLPAGLTGGDYRENTWDQASGTLILEEAGGAVCDQYGRPLDFTTGAKLDNNKGVIAAVHRDLLVRVVAAVGRVLEAPPAKG
jgi:3'(2'), 5'-bisphosphate nucleotidase